jgi:DNA-binding NtrC family response regulator
MAKVQYHTGSKTEHSRLAHGKQEPLKLGIDSPVPNVLVVDDDTTIRQQLERLYCQSGYSVVTVGSAEEAIRRLHEGDIDFAITDVQLPGTNGVELISYMHESFPEVPVIAITDYSDLQTAVKVLKAGASDFVVKPFDLGAVQNSTRAALEKSNVYMQIRHLRRWLKDRSSFEGILSKTPEMHSVFEIIRMVAPTEMTVLVQGETGTGKELVASAIHHQSGRRGGQFVTINCAGFPESLLESELFGHEKGAFTGADHAKPGKIELADGGTLFLDEIESISVGMQGKLLRVLEDQKVQRLGDTKSTRVNMRVIAATNIPLKEMVAEGKMRADFYYRINVIPIHLVPLRQRRIDIPLLVHDFLRRHPVAASRGITAVSKQTMIILMDYHWPGNIRELQNVIERAIVLTTGAVIDIIDFSDHTNEAQRSPTEALYTSSLEQWMREQEKEYIAHRLQALHGNVALTAKSCGVGLRTLSRKIRLHNLDVKTFKRSTADFLNIDVPKELNTPASSEEKSKTDSKSLRAPGGAG